MGAEKFKVIAKVPLLDKKTVLLRIGNGAGMLAGGTSKVEDIETGTESCNLSEGQTLQNFVESKVVDPRCLACFFRGLTCQASA